MFADVLPDDDRGVEREPGDGQVVEQRRQDELGHVEQDVHVLGKPWPSAEEYGQTADQCVANSPRVERDCQVADGADQVVGRAIRVRRHGGR